MSDHKDYICYNQRLFYFQTYIEAAISHDSLEHSPSQVQKCHELYNTLLVRHGVILLGPTGGGKSSVVSILAAALNRCYTDYYGPKSFHAISTEPSSMMITGSLSQVEFTTISKKRQNGDFPCNFVLNTAC